MLSDVRMGLKEFFDFYNTERIHQTLDYRTPWEVYAGIDMVKTELSTY